MLSRILEAVFDFLFGRWIALYSAEEHRKIEARLEDLERHVVVVEASLQALDEFQADLDYLKEH
jgi:hypothetical protein